MNNSANDERDLDLVIWGATGFTGSLAVSYLIGDATKFHSFRLRSSLTVPSSLRWAIAGRNRTKLESTLTNFVPTNEYGASINKPELIVCQADDKTAIDAFVKRTKVVVGFAGPFVKYSDRVVQSCVESGTHWVDISGEVAWHRSLIDRFYHKAKRSGACIVSHCGYDSIPSDLGTFLVVEELRDTKKLPVEKVVNYQQGISGMSGGTLATGLIQQETGSSAGIDPNHPFLLGGAPSSLVSAGRLREEDGKFSKSCFDESVNRWIGPFAMAEINNRVVRRSNALLGYGSEFRYTEVGVYRTENEAKKVSLRTRYPPPPSKIREMIEAGRLPQPGQGPSPKQRAKSRFQSTIVATNTVGDTLCGVVKGGECGYEETAKMAVEAGLALLLDSEACPGLITGGGFLTPSACMGHALIRRLQKAGITFKINGGDAKISGKDAVSQFYKDANEASKLKSRL